VKNLVQTRTPFAVGSQSTLLRLARRSRGGSGRVDPGQPRGARVRLGRAGDMGAIALICEVGRNRSHHVGPRRNASAHTRERVWSRTKRNAIRPAGMTGRRRRNVRAVRTRAKNLLPVTSGSWRLRDDELTRVFCIRDSVRQAPRSESAHRHRDDHAGRAALAIPMIGLRLLPPMGGTRRFDPGRCGHEGATRSSGPGRRCNPGLPRT
jgi:hypothetical protein